MVVKIRWASREFATVYGRSFALAINAVRSKGDVVLTENLCLEVVYVDAEEVRQFMLFPLINY